MLFSIHYSSFSLVCNWCIDLGRVWAGHNIEEFDCRVIKEAYAKSKREAPRYKFLIDTLPLLTQWFGKRAGDLKVYYSNFLLLINCFCFQLLKFLLIDWSRKFIINLISI